MSTEREAFEAWCKAYWGNQAYLHTSRTCGEWDAWQARAALAAAAQVKPFAWVLKTGHGNGLHFGDRPPVEGVGWVAVYTGAAPAQPADPVEWQYKHVDALTQWEKVEPDWRIRQTLEQRIAELRAFRYDGKPCYEVRALYTAPQAPQPLTLSDEQIDAAIRDPLDKLLDIILEYGTSSEAVRPAARKLARTVLAAAQEPKP